MTDSLHLKGLDGANPLGFLAALGVLALCDRMGLRPRMAWQSYANSYRPMLYGDDLSDFPAQIADLLKRDLEQQPPAWCDGTLIKRPSDEYRRFAEAGARSASLAERHAADFVAAYASDVATEEKSNFVTPTRFSFANGQSGKVLLRDYRDLVRSLTDEHIDEALCQPWRNVDACKTFRWEPRDLRLYALRADDPGTNKVYSTHGANVVAFWGLTLLPSFPIVGGDLASTAFARLPDKKRSADFFSWPIWDAPINRDTVASLLAQSSWHRPNPDPELCAQVGIHAVFRSMRLNYQKSLYFTYATSV